jgi:pimeloyl-ACP methyl ester carboxylesterase
MVAVLLHGNPETPAIWRPLQAHLRRSDVITLQLPGFGVPVPDGFGATKEEYVEWLCEQLAALGEPVDLVGHDWGGGFTFRVATTRPDLLRSWVCDVAGLAHPDYVWHDFAQIWQTPGAGEEFFASTADQPREDRIAMMEAIGVVGGVAGEIVDAGDELMNRCVLALYRSAAQPAMVEWGRLAENAAARPGLVLAPTDDHFAGGVELAGQMATRMGARFVVIEGQGHWWMLGDPVSGAAILDGFWESLDR